MISRSVFKQIVASVILINLILIQKINAASFTVKKIKGKQAIVEFTGAQLEDGKTYKIASHNDDGRSKTSDSRENFIILRELTFSNLSSTISGTSAGRSSQLSLMIGYGFNRERLEFAPLLGFSTNDTGNGATTTYTAGLMGDYNFSRNTVDNFSIFGAGLEVSYAKANNASNGSSTTTQLVYGNLFWKWFPFENSICFKTDVGYLISKISSTNETNSSGFYGRGSFLIYF